MIWPSSEVREKELVHFQPLLLFYLAQIRVRDLLAGDGMGDPLSLDGYIRNTAKVSFAE